MEYKGKIDKWVIVLFVFLLIGPILLFCSFDKQRITLFVIIINVFYYLFVVLLIVPIWVRNKVELYDDYFVLSFGFQTKKIALKDITVIKKTRDVTAGSALSLDRIYIDTKEADFLIALQNNEEFISEVKKRKENG